MCYIVAAKAGQYVLALGVAEDLDERAEFLAARRRGRKRRDDAAKSARAANSDLVAVGVFCHAELRVCRADNPEAAIIRRK
jgi:hypothetical protein